MGNEITMEGIHIFHDSLIFNASRKNHGFFMGHQFSDTINYNTVKIFFIIHGFFNTSKKPLNFFTAFHGIFMGV